MLAHFALTTNGSLAISVGAVIRITKVIMFITPRLFKQVVQNQNRLHDSETNTLIISRNMSRNIAMELIGTKANFLIFRSPSSCLCLHVLNGNRVKDR